MIKNKIVILPLEGEFAHSADFLRQTAVTIAKNDNQVYIYNLNLSHFWLKKKPLADYPNHLGITFHAPKYYLPLRRFSIIEKLNRLISFWLFVNSFGAKEKVLWFFYPNHFDIATISSLNCTKIYDCVDYQSSKRKEELLINEVDHFFTNSPSLTRLHSQQSKKPIQLKAQGFFVPNERRVKNFDQKFSKPVIGFIGGINYRIDFPLVGRLVEENPQWQFVFFGPRQKEVIMDRKFKTSKWLRKLKKYPNVFFGNSHDRYQVYGLIKKFDVGIIPYNMSINLNKYCYPMKIFEYLYFGKPVVSSNIESLRQDRFKNAVRIALRDKDWQKAIGEMINKRYNKRLAPEFKKVALENSWERKIEDIFKHIFLSADSLK